MVSEKWYAIWEAAWCYEGTWVHVPSLPHKSLRLSRVISSTERWGGWDKLQPLRPHTLCSLVAWTEVRVLAPCPRSCHRVPSSQCLSPNLPSWHSGLFSSFLLTLHFLTAQRLPVACLPLELWVMLCSQQSRGDSTVLLPGVPTAASSGNLIILCSLPVFTSVAPGMRE